MAHLQQNILKYFMSWIKILTINNHESWVHCILPQKIERSCLIMSGTSVSYDQLSINDKRKG